MNSGYFSLGELNHGVELPIPDDVLQRILQYFQYRLNKPIFFSIVGVRGKIPCVAPSIIPTFVDSVPTGCTIYLNPSLKITMDLTNNTYSVVSD